MSGGLLQYSGLVTKTRAMHGRLLSEEEFSWLTEFENVEDFIHFLRDSGGYGVIYRSHEEIHHRAQVEAVIRDSLFADYRRLYQFAGGVQRKGLEIVFFRYEVDVLKTCLEYAFQGEGNANLSYLNLFFNKHSSFNTERLIHAKNMAELVSVLAGTPYEKLFLRLQDNPSLSYGDCAFALDIFYYKKAWKLKEKLSDAGMRKVMAWILGTEIDWQNIMWMYREKQFYRMRTSDIAANLIPVQYKLKREEIRRMAEAETVEEFLDILKKTAYFAGRDAIVKMEEEITYRHILDRTYEQVCKKFPNSLAPVLKYLYDKEHEIDILTTILEGIRYQVPPREIREMIL